MFFPFCKGFATSAGLIVSIGAQNAFVIRQSMQKKHLFMTACVCSTIDAFLIMLGTMGFGGIVADFPEVLKILNYFAIAFLFIYGAISLKSVWDKKTLVCDQRVVTSSATKTLVMLFALGLLNPHAYVDTILLLGSVASQQPLHEQLYFAVGAIGASFFWFFSLTYGVNRAAPLLKHPNAAKCMDAFCTLSMWLVAFSLMTTL